MIRQAFAVLLAVVLWTGAALGADENFYRTAKVGQWTEYANASESMGTKMTTKTKTTLTAIDDKSYTIKIETEINGKALPAQEIKSTFEAVDKQMAALKREKLEEGDETITAGGKSYKCHWTKFKIVVDNPQAKTESVTKAWVSTDVPLGGVVKSESESTTKMNGQEFKGKATQELTGSGS